MSVIVLVHALGSSARAWQPQVAALAERHKVLAPDLPGHGEAPGPFGLEPAAFAVAELIAAEPEPVHLVGISVGATVAMLAALDDPARIASLTLSGGTAHAPGVALQRNLMRLMPTGMIAALMSGMYAGGRPDRKSQAKADLRTAGKRAFVTGLTELAALDLRPRLADLKTPALILCGTKDKENIASARELAEALPNAHLDLIPEAGHIWNLQFPDLFTAKLTEFIDR
jgi:3-oxoadipate enol-lactonase